MSMEPMTMGSPMSPVGSPASPGAHGAQSPYLPGYLLGEPTPTPSSAGRLWSASSGGSSQKSWSKGVPFSGYTPSPATQGNQTPAGSTGYVGTPRTDPRSRELLGPRTKEKAGAPPVQGLLESMTTTGQPTDHKRIDLDISAGGGRPSYLATPITHDTPGATSTPSMFATPRGAGQDSSFYGHPQKTPPSPAQIDPFYTQGEDIGPDDDLDETWITIFGFPPAATSFILQQFSQYGNILKHVIAPDGNWMHLHYQSKLQAKKALSKNGKVFGNSIMVGVTSCIDKSVMGDMIHDTSAMHRSSYLDTPTFGRQQQSHSQSFCGGGAKGPVGGGAMGQKHTPIRPLTAAYKAASSEHEVLNTTNTPQKNNNIVSKAFEYMFGW